MNQIQVSSTLGGSTFGLQNASGSMTGTATYFEKYGSWVLKTADGLLSGLEVESISPGNSDLMIDMQNSGGTVRVTNTASYTANVSDPNTLVTKDWTQKYVASSSYVSGMADVSSIYFKSGSIVSRVTTSAAGTKIYFNESQRAQVTATGLDVDNVNIFTNTVSNTSSNNLILTSVGGRVEVDSVLQINDKSSPSASSGTTKVWSASDPGTYTGTGKSGIYFTNLINTDELISKNRALLFSILF